MFLFYDRISAINQRNIVWIGLLLRERGKKKKEKSLKIVLLQLQLQLSV